MKGHFSQNCILPSRWAWLEPSPQPRNGVFSPVSCLLSKTSTTALDVLIQVGGLAFNREIKARGWCTGLTWTILLPWDRDSGACHPVWWALEWGSTRRGIRSGTGSSCAHQVSSTSLRARSSHRLITAGIWLIFSLTISYISSSAFKITKPPGSSTSLIQVHPGLYSKLWYNPQSLNVSQALSFPNWQAARKAMNTFFTVMHLASDSGCCYYAVSVSVWTLKKRKNVQVLRGERKSTNPT